jgi:hypothetical protein
MCLYAVFISIQKPFTFSQLDIPDVRMWMVHAMIEDGTKQKRDLRRESGEHIPHPDAGTQPHVVKAHIYQLDPQKSLNLSSQGIYIAPETQMAIHRSS